MKRSKSVGFIIWITGLPASGKTTLAKNLKEQLGQRQIQAVILDSDDLRTVLTPNPAYTEEERDWFYNVIAYLAAFLANEGINVLIASTAHRRHYRNQVREQTEQFAEVYVQCQLETCQERDPKGIYALAKVGKADSVPGIGVKYERPLKPEATVDTTSTSPQEAAQLVLVQLQNAGVIAFD